MRKKILFIIPLILLVASGCNITISNSALHQEQGSGHVITQQRDVSGFDQVSFGGIGTLDITQGEHESLTIEADDNLIDHIQSSVVGNQLRIRFEPNFNVTTPSDIHYTLVVIDLSNLELSGFGDVNLDKLKAGSLAVELSGSGNLNLGDLQTDTLDITISGFGNITLDRSKTKSLTAHLSGSGNLTLEDLQAETLEVAISGFGNTEVSGKVTDLNVDISGSGNFKGGELSSKTASVAVGGLGGATVWADSTLDVRITGSGNVKYYGVPQVTEAISGLGELESLGNK